MCGLAGILSTEDRPVDPAELRAMGASLAHRGPDDEGLVIAGRVGFAHRRLSILDLSDSAHQPMWDPCGKKLIAYNGEIYNFREVRDALTQRGVTIRSSGDTEVLLSACGTFGLDDCLPRLDGMFAFALWNADEEALYLARDRMGIKPLYYSVVGGKVLFASEIKALLLLRPAEPEPMAMTQAIVGQAVNDPQTLFKGIQAVEPGAWVRFDGSGRKSHRFWFRLSDEVDPDRYRAYAAKSMTEVTEELDERLRHSVSIHMISDAPVAMLASGGLDSSLIGAMAVRGGQSLPLYHADVVGPASELGAATALSEALGVPLHKIDLTREAFVRDLAKVTFFHETPSAQHPNDVPFHLICRLARHHGIKVLLTGEGADELFLGYPWMIDHAARRRLKQATSRIGGWVQHLPLGATLLKAMAKLKGQPECESLLPGRRAAERQGSESFAFIDDPVERSSMIDSYVCCFQHLRSLLYRNDRMGMMESLESRIPFLENDLIRMAMNLPPKFKIAGGFTRFLFRHPYRSNKLALRAVGRRYLPTHLAQRRKLGFLVDSLAYVQVRGDFFAGGFLSEFLGLSQEQTEALLRSGSRDLVWSLFSSEVFGRIFFRGVDHERVAQDVLRCATAGAAS